MLSLLALVVAIVLSCTSRVNVGVLAAAFAWLIGSYAAGLSVNEVIGGFPTSLFLTLAGVTLLFGLADVNGTLERVAHRTVRLAGGSPRLMPVAFFFIAGGLAAVGPGSISAVALVIPLAMAIGPRAGVPRLLTALVVALGANAGNLSPISAVGVIANSRMADAGIGGHATAVFVANFATHALAAAGVYLIVSRSAAFRPSDTPAPAVADADTNTSLNPGRIYWTTVAVLATWIVGVTVFKLNVGLSAFAAAAVLVLLGAGDESRAVSRMPWGVILMVSGVTLLIAVLEKTGGMELFAALLAMLATPATINGTMAFVTGLISIWSSTSGVVLPAFLPTVPAVVAQVGGGDPVAVALSINVGSSMVDVSPLSTLGALCVAAVADPHDAHTLFRQLMVWGVSMAVVAALMCQFLAPIFARL